MSVSAPAASGGIDAEDAIPSVDVNLPSTSVSLDAPGERLLQQIGFGLPCAYVVVFRFCLVCLPSGFVLGSGKCSSSWSS